MEILVANAKNPAMDTGLLDNRSKLLRLAETVKPTTRRSKAQHTPRHSKGHNIKEDPTYTNIEHLVFGPCRTPSSNPFKERSIRASPCSSSNATTATSTTVAGSTEAANHHKVASAPGCYHSLDRSRLLCSGPKDVPADAHSNITLLRVEYLPPAETSTAVEVDRGRGRSLISRNQQKTPVHVNQRLPTQRSLSDASEAGHGGAARRPVLDRKVINSKEQRRSTTYTSIPSGSKFGLPPKTGVGPTKTIIKIGAPNNRCDATIYRESPKQTVQDSDTSSSSLNTSLITSISDTPSSSIHLSRNSNVESSDDLATPSPPNAARPLSSSRPQAISRVPQATNTSRSPMFTHRSSSAMADEKRKPTSRIPPRQTTTNASRREVGKKTVTLSETPTTTSGSRQGVNGSSHRESSSPKGPRTAAVGTTTFTGHVSPKMQQSSRIPGRPSTRSSFRSSIATQQRKERETTKGPKSVQSSTEIKQISATTTTPVKVVDIHLQQKLQPDEADDSSYKQESITLVKPLPHEHSERSSSRGSPERYSMERPSRALYTWYETRRRPSLVTITSINSSDINAIPTTTTESGIVSNGKRTASLPKSILLDKLNRSKPTTPYDTNDPTRIENFVPIESRPEMSIPPSESINYFDTHQCNNNNNNRNAMEEKKADTNSSELEPNDSTASQPEGDQQTPGNNHDEPSTAEVSQIPVLDINKSNAAACCKALRRLKASSSPGALTGRPEMSASEGDLRRPWSQVYSEEEAARALEGASCTDLRPPCRTPTREPPSPPNDSCKGMMLLPPFASRCSSLRAPHHQPLSVLQKFRKSFSLRFYRNKGTAIPTQVVTDRPSTPFPSAAGSEGSASTFSVASAAEEEDSGEPLFRFGPLVWRSSKEKKSKNGRSTGGSGNSANCSSPDSGIQVEGGSPRRVPSVCPATPPSTWAQSSHSPLARRGQSSFRLERPPRPLSEAGSACSSSTMLDHNKISATEDKQSVRRTFSDLGAAVRCSTRSEKAIPPLVKMRSEKRISIHRLRRRQGNLRRSVSQPMDMEKMTSCSSLSQGVSDVEDNDCVVSSDDETSSEGELNSNFHSYKWTKKLQNMEYVTYAEALWDHVTLDPQELPLKVGDLVAVLDCTNRHWWVGALENRIGWFPAAFVRPKVHQDDMEENLANSTAKNSQMNGEDYCISNSPSLSNEQVRTNVIQEIIATEKDYVKHLKDVIEGYLKQMRKRVDMFTEERVNTIFGNIEQILIFQTKFFASLENCIDWDNPHLSQVGSCFVEHKEGFQVYSDYCNNHPRAANELQELFTIPKYAHFFEACRLLQDMIDISLDGFLLTPIQKICKYPLQLAELLKYTPLAHPDRPRVVEALESMRQVALYINERKRRMECLEKLAFWQISVEYWEGPNLLEHSSQLIHSGDVSKLSSSWSRDLTLFLFDHQLIMCKKDLLKRNTFCYKSRINMDESEVHDLPDGRDMQSGLTVKYSWRIHCRLRDKWYTFCSKTLEEKNQWMKAFKEERQKVNMDKIQGFMMSEKAKAAAIVLANNRLKRTKSKNGKEFRAWRLPPVNLINNPAMKAKTSSLPQGFLLNKKKPSGWFAFGSNKKHRR